MVLMDNLRVIKKNEHEIDRRRVVVITGASAGLGRAVVREFAKKGADIALIAGE